MADLTWLPNFLIAGAPKAGTSSLQRWIADHPDAFGSTDKETYFLVDPGTHMHRPGFHVSQGLETWQAQFPVPPGSRPKIIVESTPAYIYYQTALQVAPDLPSRPKCLFILREPGAQIHSLYSYFRDNWDWVPADMGFAEFLEAARQGSHGFKGNELARNAFAHARYIDFLEPWQARLGEDRMMVATFDELKSDQRGLTRRVAEWLGLDPGFYEDYGFPRENETYTPRNRALQSLNVKLRSHLPKGRAYELARGIYRRLNTQKRRGPQDGDKQLIASLGQEFAGSNRRLAGRFGLDLRSWPV
ncbi:sulfotransferase domain-containing protein (plasmid) [Leisingera sp. S132]|uniref:sulfotransferase domain-containing protein n=1 Tax=Leisingera sp. S132 TaxID=2867016 RepID=UPI0021A7BF2A|nr:sulfotransferase domain-containing protein [Leisingera sp. S132]UWQ81906.1 sulfotransferase domain-containing protein [Leisingera sp. S132]